MANAMIIFKVRIFYKSSMNPENIKYQINDFLKEWIKCGVLSFNISMLSDIYT